MLDLPLFLLRLSVHAAGEPASLAEHWRPTVTGNTRCALKETLHQ